MDSRNGVWQCTRVVVRYCNHSVRTPLPAVCPARLVHVFQLPVFACVPSSRRKKASPVHACPGARI